MAIRVVIADDHPTVRFGIRKFLEKSSGIEIVGEAMNGKQALKLVDDLKPDVLLLDIEMPDISGFEVARRLAQMRSATKTLAVSAYSDRGYILGMLHRGASGYITKDEVPAAILRAVRSVARGNKVWLSPQAALILNPLGNSQ